jgi:pectinesterase
MPGLLSLCFFALLGVALGLSSPPSGAITVGTGGKYATLQAALADTSSSTYFVYSGTYTGQVNITRSGIKIYGQTFKTGTYTGNSVTLTRSMPTQLQ